MSNIFFLKKGMRLGSAKHCTENDSASKAFHIYNTCNNLFGLEDLQQPEKWNKPESPAAHLLVSMRRSHTIYKDGADFA